MSSQHIGEKTEMARQVFETEKFAAFHVDHNEYLKNNCSSVVVWVSLGWKSDGVGGAEMCLSPT